MKINEIITEAVSLKFPSGQSEALPDMKKHTDLQSSDPYRGYRFGVNLGASPTFDHGCIEEGPVGQALVTVAYTDACEKIIDATERALGVKASRIAGRGSKESDDVNKSSPVVGREPVALKIKKVEVVKK